MAYTHIWFHISYTIQSHITEINCKRADRDKAPVFSSYTFSPVSPIFWPVSPTFSPVSPTFSPVSVERKTWSCWHWHTVYGRLARVFDGHCSAVMTATKGTTWDVEQAAKVTTCQPAWPRTSLLELPSACVCLDHSRTALASSNPTAHTVRPNQPKLVCSFLHI